MKRQIFFILLLVAIVLSLTSLYYRIEMGKFLVLYEQATDSRKLVPIPQNRFQINYTHSVHKTPVEELFYIAEDNNLILYEIRFSSLGIGMPYESEGGVFSNQEGQFRLTGLHKEFPAIDMRASEIPAQTLTVEGQKYPLLTLFQPDSTIHFSAVKRLRLVRKGARDNLERK